MIWDAIPASIIRIARERGVKLDGMSLESVHRDCPAKWAAGWSASEIATDLINQQRKREISQRRSVQTSCDRCGAPLSSDETCLCETKRAARDSMMERLRVQAECGMRDLTPREARYWLGKRAR